MMLGFFTEEAYDKLFESVNENKNKYLDTCDWVSNFFKPDEKWYGISSQQVDNFIPYCPNIERKSESDIENAIRLYKAFHSITPLQATNKYMWAYMCHMDKSCRKYMQYRWSNSNPAQKYFVPQEGGMGLYFFNGLSRLWWWVHLTYDKENKENPYALTEILFKNQMLGKDILDTLNRANLKRMKGILLAIQAFQNQYNPKNIVDYFRECKKELNQYAAIRMFDFLEYEDIREITFNSLIKLHESKKIKMRSQWKNKKC